MPIYDFLCPQCGKVLDVYAKMDEREKIHSCGSTMTRLLSLGVNAIQDIQPYMDENLGPEPVYIRSRRHQRDELKRRGLVQLG
jgi:putative FmdB family regulatory protein